MPTLTPNYGFNLPLINNATDQDLWGGYLNANWSNIDGYLLTASNRITRTVTGTDTATTADRNKLILGNATSGSYVQTLPSAATVGNGFLIAFTKTDATSNTITITRAGSDTIGGSNTYVLDKRNEGLGLVSDGVSTWYFLTPADINVLIRSVNVQVFTTSGTYTPTAGMVYCKMTAIGAGGGGGGSGASNGSTGGGGGSGSYTIGLFSASTVGASRAVTIGAAGTAGSAGTGGTGGTTSVTGLLSAPGGLGGLMTPVGLGGGAFISAGGLAGSGASGGYLNSAGSPGNFGVGANLAPQGFGGNGGASILGGGGAGGNNTTGANATSRGAGGGGGGNAASTARIGGTGGAGLVIVEEYIA